MAAAVSLLEGVQPAADDLVLEPAPESALPFILDAWVRSYQALIPPYAKTYGMGSWDWTKYAATKLLARGALCLVARFSGIEDAYLGFGCAAGHVPGLHYVYIKQRFEDGGIILRRRGFAKAIVGELLTQSGPFTRITHRPGSGRGNMRQKAHALGWRYEPLTKEELER
jgi:hypothetical protein